VVVVVYLGWAWVSGHVIVEGWSSKEAWIGYDYKVEGVKGYND
jgi:hypothetical protein